MLYSWTMDERRQQSGLSGRELTAAATLKACVESRGIRLADLAKRLEVTEATVSRWLAGKRRPPLAVWMKLADLLFVSLDDLVGRNRS